MKFSELAEDTRNWIANVINEGHPTEQVIETLLQHGHPQTIKNAVSEYVEDLKASGHVIRPSTTSIFSTSPSRQRTSDREIQVLMAINNPRIMTFANLLSDEECDELVALSKKRLTPSTVINPVSGSYDKQSNRTSYGASFYRKENPLICRIEKRISELFGIPESRGEPIQTLNYAPGAEYKPHFDFFDPRVEGNKKPLEMGGQRIATLIMYLNDVEVGGSTIFPRLGLDVMPAKGHAVYFAYSNETGVLDENTLHGGSPVTRGEKWIATKWLRINDYTGPMA